MHRKNIDFVARHYRRGRFSVNSAWRSLGIAPSYGLRRFRAAAAVAGLVILSVTATVLYKEYSYDRAVPEAPATRVVLSPIAEVKVIDFEKTPLPQVVEQIEAVYAVKVNNLPDDAEDLVLSLHYEGTPAELVAIINDILGTELTVSEK